MSVVEGAIEAIDEKGEHLAEKVTDVAGKAALGIGKSLDKQLNEHAKYMASVAGRTMVQGIDGLSEGLETELKAYYENIPYTEDFESGVEIIYFAKYMTLPVIDAYFVIPEDGEYTSKFECYDQNDQVFLIKNIDISRAANKENKPHTLVSFGLNAEEEANFKNIKNVKITVVKSKL